MSDINFEFWSRKKLNDESVKILGHWKQDRDFLNTRIRATKAYQELLLDAQSIQQKRLGSLESKLAKAVDCLKSISKNSCCDKCQEAGLWARKTLEELEKGVYGNERGNI